MTDQELAAALFNAGLMTREQIEAAAAERTPQKKFAQVVVEKGWLTAAQISQFDAHALPSRDTFDVTAFSQTSATSSLPQTPFNSPASAPPIPPPGGFSPVYRPTYEQSVSGTAVLVLGILGFIICQLLAPVAWYMGNQAIAAIDSGRANPAERTSASVGRILGIIGTIFLIIGLVFFVLVAVASFTGKRVSNTFTMPPNTTIPPGDSFTVPR